jgi:hypothetical protein
LQRAVLDAHTDACEAFFRRYYDANGFLARERWGGDDGPDDAIENVNDWPQLYALGADESIRTMYEHAYEGHVRQYTLAKTTQVPFAREACISANSRDDGLAAQWRGADVFNNMGLGNPYGQAYRDRVRRFAGFYTGEDPSAPNYDSSTRSSVDVQRQPWAADAQGDRAGLGGRSGGTGRGGPERPAAWRA